MKNLKFYIASVILIAALVVSFAVPRPQYQGTSILQDLKLPVSFAEWKSADYAYDIAASVDERYNFLSGAFARIYGVRNGRSLLLLILDAGNFHHPRLCYKGAGYNVTEMDETQLKISSKTVKVKTFLAEKSKDDSFVVMFWMVIDKEQVNWTEQKWTQLWHSLFNKKQVGLMTRLDIPIRNGDKNEAIAFGQKFIAALSASIPAEKQEWLFGR